MSKKLTKGIFYGLVAVIGAAGALIGQVITDRNIDEEVEKALKEKTSET